MTFRSPPALTVWRRRTCSHISTASAIRTADPDQPCHFMRKIDADRTADKRVGDGRPEGIERLSRSISQCRRRFLRAAQPNGENTENGFCRP